MSVGKSPEISKVQTAGLKGDQPIFTLFTEIGIIAQLSTTLFESALPKGMTNAQHSVLNHLIRREETQTIGELASAFQVTQPTMSSTIRKLEDKGLVELRPQPGDRRVRRVAVTRAGELARDAGLDAARGLKDELGPMISKREIDTVLPILSELRAKLDAARD
ncbi:MAG: MarR family transcriptional regulator [Sphingomonadaceae bacterium]|nr:MarR family transcriptional regulator [Sphingomonadaceae bacterium]